MKTTLTAARDIVRRVFERLVQEPVQQPSDGPRESLSRSLLDLYVQEQADWMLARGEDFDWPACFTVELTADELKVFFELAA